MTVYADVIFLVNFVSSYIMLYLLGKFIAKAGIKKKRLAAASVIGGLSAALMFSLEITAPLAYFVRLLFAVIMVFTAFYEQKRQVVSHILWLMLMSGIMVSAMLMLTAFAVKSFDVAVRSGIVYFNLPYRIFLPMLVLSYGSIVIFLKILLRRRAKKRYIISVTHNDKTITVPALFDSGNLLREPVTGKCVSMLEWSEARKLFDAEYDFSELGAHAEEIKLWAVPFHSVENKSGIIFAFLADKLAVPEEKKEIQRTFIGLYGGKLSENNEYQALINAALM